jgi:hypothetical protein
MEVCILGIRRVKVKIVDARRVDGDGQVIKPGRELHRAA